MTLEQVLADFEKTLADATAVGASVVVADCEKGIADTKSLMGGTVTYQWNNLSTGTGPNGNQGWWKGVCLTNGLTYLSCGGLPSQGANFGSFTFDPVALTWTRLNTDSVSFWKNLLGAENYSLAYDPDRNYIYKSQGSPNGWYNGNPPPPQSGNENTSAHYGELRYVVSTDTWYTDWPNASVTFRPTPAQEAYWNLSGQGLTMSVADGVIEYYQNSIFAFGAFSVGRGNLHRRDANSGAITVISTDVPPWTLPSRTPELRSGLDHRSGQLWTLADNCELYTHTGNVGDKWQHVVTTGTKPVTSAPPGSTGTDWGIVAALDETHNCIVAWCGCAATVRVPGMATVQATWVLDLTSLIWTQVSFTGPQPYATPSVLCNLLYNPARQCCTLLVADNYAMDVWEFNIS